MSFDVLRFATVQGRQISSRIAYCAKQFVELGVDRLGISMLSALNEESHSPRSDGRKRLPIEGVRADHKPRDNVEPDDAKCGWMGCRDTNKR
jgi:hypothetical protein